MSIKKMQEKIVVVWLMIYMMVPFQSLGSQFLAQDNIIAHRTSSDEGMQSSDEELKDFVFIEPTFQELSLPDQIRRYPDKFIRLRGDESKGLAPKYQRKAMEKGVINLRNYYLDEANKIGFDRVHMMEVYQLIARCPLRLPQNALLSLLNSKKFVQLTHLDLRYQNIDDQLVEILSRNKSLRRLYNIDLSENSELTDKALKYIQDSTYIGSIRTHPKVFKGEFASIVILSVHGTNITKKGIYDRVNNPKKDFVIEFRDIYGKSTNNSATTVRGIKKLSIKG